MSTSQRDGGMMPGPVPGRSVPAPALPRAQVSVKAAAKVAATALGVVVAAWIVWKTTGALVLTLIALLIAVALDRAVTIVQGHGVRRGVAIALVFCALLVILAGLGWLVIPKLVDQASALVRAAPDIAQRFRTSHAYELIERRVDVDALLGRMGSVLSPALQVVGWTVEALAGGVTVLFVTIFMLTAGSRLLDDLLAQARPERRTEYRDVLARVYRALSGYVAGHLTILAVQGVATAVALAIAGVPFFLPLGLLSALASLVPFAGVLVMGTAVSLLAWGTSGLWSGVGVAIYYVLYQQFENHVLYPVVYRHTVNVNPLVIILAVLFMADLGGIAGAILAVPTAAAGHIVVGELLAYRRRCLRIPEPKH
jgi:putative heme transporter